MYEETYQQLQQDLKESNLKREEHLKAVQELEKKIEMLEEFIAPFEQHFVKAYEKHDSGFRVEV